MNIPLDKFEDYLRNKNLKERTIENYIYYFNKFTYGVFNQETVSGFLSLKANRNEVARSFLINLQKFMKTNYRELGISEDIKAKVSEVELPKLTGRKKKRIIKPIPHEQIELIENKLPSEKLKLQLLLSYYCALRLGELLKINILSFNWEEWKKNMDGVGECIVHGKGDKEGIALVPSFMMKRVAKYIRQNKFKSVNSKVFVSEKEGAKIMNRGRIWQMKLRKAGIDSGVTKLDSTGAPIKDTVVHPHRLRHSYAHYLLNVKKLNLREVQEMLRHDSIQSTQIYTYVDKEELKKKL